MICGYGWFILRELECVLLIDKGRIFILVFLWVSFVWVFLFRFLLFVVVLFLFLGDELDWWGCLIGCDDEGEGVDCLEVEGIGENEEGEVIVVVIVRMGIGVMMWWVLLL